MAAGSTISMDDVKILRPGIGLAPKQITALLGRTVNKDVNRGEPVSFEFLS
jgi:N-acetylneuraminate synthase